MENNQNMMELPRGWVLATLGEIAESINPGFPSGAHNQIGKGVPHLRPMNISYYGRLDLGEVKYVDVENYEHLKRGDILFNNTNSPALLGKTAVIKKSGDLAYSNHMTRIRLFRDASSSDYIGWYLHFLFWKGFFKLNCTNHVNQASINKAFLENKVSLFLPPLAEQHRIVAKIEELFSDLDAGIASLKQAQAQLKTYRQAVLKYAFEGKLTAAWREQNKPEPAEKLLAQIKVGATRRVAPTKRHGKSKKPKEFPPLTEAELAELPELPEGWCWMKLGNLSMGVEYGSAKKSKEEGKIPVIRMGNLQNGVIVWDDLVYTDDEDEINQYFLRKDDVLFNRTNSPELVGKTAIYKGERPAIFAGYLIRINQVSDVDARYLNYFLNCHIAKNHGNRVKTDGVNQSNINGEKLGHYPFPLVSKEEQHQIVQEIESRLSVCDKLEESIKESLQKAEALRQSILKKAFEGKLVPQDPNDEPAEKLLERIRAERAQLEQNTNAKKK